MVCKEIASLTSLEIAVAGTGRGESRCGEALVSWVSGCLVGKGEGFVFGGFRPEEGRRSDVSLLAPLLLFTAPPANLNARAMDGPGSGQARGHGHDRNGSSPLGWQEYLDAGIFAHPSSSGPAFFFCVQDSQTSTRAKVRCFVRGN